MSGIRHRCFHCELMLRVKPSWGPGPWQDEPDYAFWTSPEGLPCVIHRGGGGALCGYVGVPTGHPLHGQESGKAAVVLPVGVHGGVTWAGGAGRGICHAEDEPPDAWFLGFDCMHAWDVCPESDAMCRESGLPKLGPDMGEGMPKREYRTLAYVRSQVEMLAVQLHALSHVDEDLVRRALEGSPHAEAD